jgi:hydroxyacylglutathione hydrolase
MIKVNTFTFNPFQENTYLLSDHTKKCKVIDPGMNSDEERKEFDQFLIAHDLVLEAIVNTHCHVDHVLGCKYLKEKYNVPFCIHRQELQMLENVQLFGEYFGLETEPPPAPDEFISENDLLTIGDSKLKIIHVPGHSEGSLVFYSLEDGFLIAGDVLFRGSIGRTDLPGGDYNTLIYSIRSKILTLPLNTRVFPGHGPYTTVENESKTNPFLI